MLHTLTRRGFVQASSLAAALAAITASSGCSGSSSSGGDSKTLTYWASNQGTSIDADKEALTPLLETFTEDTGITVNLEVIGWNELQTRIQTAVTSGDAPEIGRAHV